MRSLFRVSCLFFIMLVLTSCISGRQHNQAILKLESAWKETNKQILEKEGRRSFKATRKQGFVAAQLSARRLGMVIEQQNYETGFLFVTAPAPVPLTMSDWETVQKSDTKEMRKIISEEVGILSWLVDLDPSAKDVLVNILITEQGENIEVSIGLRLRNRAIASKKVRRMEPPPTAVRMGLHKLWKVFEQELGSVIKNQISLTPEPPTVQSAIKTADSIKHKATATKKSWGNPDAIAVIIGNKNYEGGIPSVDFAHNDALAMKSFLVFTYGVSEDNIIDLRDVTLAQMEEIFGNERTYRGKLWRWVRPKYSGVIVYYSGHGIPGRKDGREYLLPVDGDPNTPEITGYPLELLYRNLGKLEALDMIVFLDTCFSGESPNGPLVKSASGISLVQRKVSSPPFTVVSASQKDQIASWDEKAQLGLFTKYLLKALKGTADDRQYGNTDNRVTLSEIKTYLDREMTYAARRQWGREQQAAVFGNPENVLMVLEEN
jgi:hypothetical protein